MSLTDGIWDKLGELIEEEPLHVLTKLFTIYESQDVNNPGNGEVSNFFKNLNNAIEQTTQCNLNRR